MRARATGPNPEPDVVVVGEGAFPDPLGIGTVVGAVVGTASGAVGGGAA